MQEALPIIVSALGLGLTAGLTPGPLQTVLIQRTLTQGWRRSIIGIFAPPLSDIPVIIVVLLLLSSFPPVLIQIIQVGGGLFLLYLAWGGFRSWRAGATIGEGDDAPPPDTTSNPRFLLRMVFVSLLSPGPYLFWGTVNGPLLRQTLDISPLAALGFILAFYVPFLLVLAGWIFLFDRLRNVDRRVTRAILLVTILILVALGARLIVQGLGLLT